MTSKTLVPALTLMLAIAAATATRAEVKTEEKNRVAFTGLLGRLTNIFGGQAAKDGVVSMVAVSGDRKMSVSQNNGQIVDLREEKIHDLDMRRKTYTVTTFDEMRKRIQDAQQKANESAREAPAGEKPAEGGREIEIDFDVKNTGQSKTINGFNTRQMLVVVTVREKGKTLEQGGGLVMTVDNWITPTVAALKEVVDFDMRYYKAIVGTTLAIDPQQLAAAIALMPHLKDAMERYQQEGIDGTPILSTLKVESVKSAEQLKAEANQGGGNTDVPTSVDGAVSGAIGGFMRRRAQNNSQNPRTTFMTVDHEVLKISTSVSAADVAMPADFKPR
jgi:hypothetical protein